MTVTLRPTIKEDAQILIDWFKEIGVLRGFPMETLPEIEDSVKYWMFNALQGAGLTATLNDKPVGMIVFYLSPFGKFAHVSLFSIIVNKAFRKRGIGSLLITAIEKLAKEKFGIKILYLEVYSSNPKARKLYERLGYVYYATQEKSIKDGSEYIDKHLLRKRL